MERLRGKAQGQEPTTPAAPTEPNPTTPTEPEEPTDPAEPTEPNEPTPTTEPEKGKTKANPWKLLKEREAELADLQAKLSDTRKLIPDEVARKTEIERLTAAEKRAQELDAEIKFVNYRKSSEFKEKYEKPYEEAWVRAMAELSELEVVDAESGETRKPVARDLWEVVNAPLIKAKQIATEKFGEFADEVMAHRKEVRRLYDEQSAALKRAESEAVQRDQKLHQQYETVTKELHQFAKETWEKANEASVADPENGRFFKPLEGDEERNSVLQKGYELVDTSSRENPLDPALTPEQRASIVKKHVAIRNRAAAYGVIKHEFKKLQAQLSEVQEKLKQYESSTPGTEGGVRPSAVPTHVRASDRVFAKLRSLAK